MQQSDKLKRDHHIVRDGLAKRFDPRFGSPMAFCHVLTTTRWRLTHVGYSMNGAMATPQPWNKCILREHGCQVQNPTSVLRTRLHFNYSGEILVPAGISVFFATTTIPSRT